MASAFDYRQMARECMREAEESNDSARKITLESIAKLYVQTAYSMELVHRDNELRPTIRRRRAPVPC